jgi:acetyl-CoA acetyltransferase
MSANDIAIVGWGMTKPVAQSGQTEPTLCLQANNAALAAAGIEREQIGFTCSGSCDYLSGGPFVFVQNLEAAVAWPPISESHVEMDGAWALYEAWVRLHHGDLEYALVYGSGKSSPSNAPTLYPSQLDPYYLGSVGLDPESIAGLQARALLDSGKATERDFAEVVARSLANAKSNPNAQVSGDLDVDELLKAAYTRAPLRAHDSAPISDGAAALVLARGDVAKDRHPNAVFITGIDHRIEPHQPGMRDLTTSSSTALAAKKAGVDKGKVDVVEVNAAFSPQELILREALGVTNGTSVNPSGGSLAGNPVMATGLIRIIEAASRVADGSAGRAVAHATNGQGLQHNMVCVLEGATS